MRVQLHYEHKLTNYCFKLKYIICFFHFDEAKKFLNQLKVNVENLIEMLHLFNEKTQKKFKLNECNFISLRKRAKKKTKYNNLLLPKMLSKKKVNFLTAAAVVKCWDL